MGAIMEDSQQNFPAEGKPGVGMDRRTMLRSVAAVAAAATTGSARADLGLDQFPTILSRRRTTDSLYKQRAMADYADSLQPFGGRLATASQKLLAPGPSHTPWQYEVAVIGSGYGASIAAARLAQKLNPGMRLCLLERGREHVPGTFPDTFRGVMDETRFKAFGPNKRSINNPTGLFNAQQFDEIIVVSGSGLGGSSLINASVAIRPDRDVFWQEIWPRELRDRGFLDPYYELAEWELGVQREPLDYSPKMTSHRIAGERLRDLGAHFEAAALMVTRGDPRSDLPVLNRQGHLQRACISCGDCLTGCNVGAKNTLASNYLPLARRFGADMFTQTEVQYVEKCQGFYRIHFVHHVVEPAGQTVQSVPGVLTAKIVVLGAGSMGSSEILLRSQMRGLNVSPRLGMSWTGNGDALGFVIRSQLLTNIGGFSAEEPGGRCVGPTIQSNLSYPTRSHLAHRVLIQEGSAARAYCNILGALMQDFDLDQTQVLLGMGHDGANGRITLLEDGHAYISWPGLLESDYRKLIRAEFAKIAEAHGGKYKFLRAFGDKMVSVHPLGGCGIGTHAGDGVVNHRGQVFDATCGGDWDALTGQPRVHDGLYVCDGAIFPTSIACNPSLTISAFAERNSQLLTMETKYADIFHL
jgi:cholesterol oxidase